VRQFVNTLDVESHTDDFSSPEAMVRWYQAHGIARPGAKATAADLGYARTVREALRSFLYANHGYEPDPAAVRTLNKALQSRPLVLQIESGKVGFQPATASGIDGALSRVLSIAFQSMADGTWQRLKICKSDTCQWAFYDRSRNRSGSWCSMAVCGNRTKVRAYQARAKQRNASLGAVDD
jgi:predicted RNA-binding Zn ribbon-like protein